jgi:type I restriction enzyme S subunit
MELITKQGYNQTEVGLIPEDWRLKTIDKLCSVSGRVGWKGYTKKDLVSSGPFAIGAKHINKRNKLDLSDPTCLSMEKYLESPEIFVLKDDLLIVQRGTIGKLVLIDSEIGEATINPSMLIIRANNGHSKYLYYYLLAKEGQVQILKDVSSTGVPMITQKQVKLFKIPLPPTLTEQKAIATALSDVDALITSLEQTITKKKAIKQGAMQQLLTGKTRVKGFEGSGKFKQTEVGLIPEDWEVEPIGDLASISTGGSDTQDRVDDGAYPFFVRSQTIERINKYSFDGEAILTSGDGVGVGKIFHYVNCKFDYHQRVYNIHNYRNDVAGKYLFFQFSTHFYDRVMAMTAKSSVDSVRREMIADMQIPLPSTLTEQQAIAQILSDMDAEITHLETQKAKYQAIKQGMMQELLTGKTRLV